jgi:hypothetical protein
MVEPVYAERVKTWNDWNDLAVQAHGKAVDSER